MSGRSQAIYAYRDGGVVYVLPWRDAGGRRVAYRQDDDFTTERVTLDASTAREIAATGREIPLACTPAWAEPAPSPIKIR